MALFARRDFRLLLGGQAISGLGDWMATFAFMALALEVSDSTAAVGGILTLRLLPAAIGGGIAARIAVRWDRRRTMLTMDLLRAAIIAVVPLVSGLWWIYLWAFALEGASVIFVSSRDAAVPSLADSDDLPTANGLVLATSYGTIPLGAGLFALFASLSIESGWFGEHPYALVFWLDALTFTASAAFIAAMSLRGHGATGQASPDDEAPEDDEPTGRLLDAWRIPLVRSVMPATAAVALGLGALFSLGIALVRDELNATDAEFGVLIVLFGLGAAVGLLGTRHMEGDLLRTTRLGVVAMGALVATLSLSPWLWLTFVGAVGFGAAATIALTAGMSALQRGVSGDQLAIAFAAFHVVIRIGLGVSAVAAGLAADALGDGTRLVLLLSGVLVILSGALVKTVTPDGTVVESAGRDPLDRDTQL